MQGSDAHTQVHGRQKSAGGQSTHGRDGQGHGLPGVSNGAGEDSGTSGPCLAVCGLDVLAGLWLRPSAHTCPHARSHHARRW